MTRKREKTIMLKQLGQKLNLNDSDIAMAKITIGAMVGTFAIIVFTTLIRKILCSQLDPSGLWYLITPEINSGLLDHFF
jgi:hypothetical protein